MLSEIEGVRQDEPGRRRRWFHGDYFELFVWQTDEGQVVMFQLCYGGATSERALVWRADIGFFHDGVPTSPAGGDLAASRFPASMVASRFTEEAKQVPDEIRAFVLVKIADYSQSPPPRRPARSRFRREEWQRRAKA